MKVDRFTGDIEVVKVHRLCRRLAENGQKASPFVCSAAIALRIVEHRVEVAVRPGLKVNAITEEKIHLPNPGLGCLEIHKPQRAGRRERKSAIQQHWPDLWFRQ